MGDGQMTASAGFSACSSVNVTPYFCRASAAFASGSCTCTVSPKDCSSRTISITRELRVSGMSSLKVSPSMVTMPPCAFRRNSPRTHSRATAGPSVIDAPAGENDLGMIARFFGAISQVIRIDADTVTADQPRLKWHEIPFCPCSGEDVTGIDVKRLEDQRQLVHECDVEIALGVLDDLCGFGDLDRGRTVNACGDDRSVDLGDDVKRRLVLRRDYLGNRFEPVLLVAGLIRSGE